MKKLEPTPTARLDRTHDKVYDATTSVVRAVMILSQGNPTSTSNGTAPSVNLENKSVPDGNIER